MEYSASNQLEIHYHIRWSDSTVDWKPFLRKEEASEHARLIKRRNEDYTIVERDGECESCKALGRLL